MKVGPSQKRLTRILLWAAPLTWIGCGGGGGSTDILLPSLTITTSTDGVDLDSDGYGVAVDGGSPRAIGLDATVTVDPLPDGQHAVELSGVAANCSTTNNPRTVTVSTGGTATAAFSITCGPGAGSVAVTTTTSGAGSDPDGFALTVDGLDRGAIGVNATISLTSLTPGGHLLGLTGMAANCVVAGDNPLSVTVTPGQATPVGFAITCAAPPPSSGSVQITTATSGSSLDPDGYTVSLDGGNPQAVTINGTLSIGSIAAGSHSVRLSEEASNCAISGDNPRAVTISSGQTATVQFAITCVAPPPGSGSVQVTTATSGSSLDPNGYTLRNDGGSPQALSINGSRTVGNLTAGAHTVLLGGNAANCTVAGDNPRAVTISSGQTATVQFAIACVAPPPGTGSVQVTAATSGSSLDPDGYTLRIDGGAPQALSINGSRTVGNLTAGTHTVLLGGNAANCPVAGDNPRSVTVAAEQTATVSFAIACAATGPTVNLRIQAMYVTQSTQSLDGTVPLVQDREGFIRVFALADRTNTASPTVRVRFFSGGSVIGTLTLNRSGSSTPTAVQEGILNSSWTGTVAASLLQPGVSILADVDPANTVAESNETDNSFPSSGTPRPLTVHAAPVAKIRFVPIQQGSAAPGNVTTANKDALIETARRIYPLHTIDTDVRAVYTTSTVLEWNGGGWDQVLGDLDGLRVAEGSDRTYFGIAKLDYQVGQVGTAYRAIPTALGGDEPTDVRRVVAHELGHTWDQLHTPCGTPPPLTIDQNYPYGTGIGVYGFDVAAGTLKPPSTPDIMGYCSNPWISDYIYRRVMTFREASGLITQSSAAAKQPALLIWGRIVNGQAVLEPAFQIVTRPNLPARPGPYTVEGIATDGSSLFRLSFDAAQVPDDPRGSRHFAFAVPLNAAGAARLSDLRLTGPGTTAASTSLSLQAARKQGGPVSDAIVARRAAGAVALEWDPSVHPMIMVRDPDSGEILSFARGGKARIATAKGTLDLVVSDQVRSQTRRITVQ
ncbi:MAG TPA: hypothetical protein VNC19_07660 [Gemmatimonadales bacterium]|nr:hypothetical protein [Gemmatimonadales bacterium]